MTKKNKRYIKLEGHKGIYKDTKNDSYLVRKKINGKEYSKLLSVSDLPYMIIVSVKKG